MSLTACSDLSPAGWIVTSTLPWQRLVEFGPSGFPAYARLRFLPDPTSAGQSENEADGDGEGGDQLATLLELLATRTRRPDDCYVCVWEGYGDNAGAGPAELGEVYRDQDGVAPAPAPAGQQLLARPGLDPAAALREPQAPRVVVPNRAYYLFRGPLADARDWDDTDLWVGQTRLRPPEPAFVWPADHAWCVASDVDPHWAGIGADSQVIDQLVSDARLDAVPADPDAEQPAYR